MYSEGATHFHSWFSIMMALLGCALMWPPRRRPFDFSPERRRLRTLRALTATQRNKEKGN